MKRAFKILGWTLLSLVVIIIIAISLAVWYLTPAKLTPIVKREATALIDGRVDMSRVELTFWKSFPQLRIDIDSLHVISHSMHSIPDSARKSLPAYTDSLLSIDHLHGGINLLSLLNGKIDLYDLTIKHLRANIVTGPDSTSNFAIFSTSGSQPADSTSQVNMPAICFDRFTLVDAGPLTFTSIPDSTFFSATLKNISIDGNDHPVYSLSIDGNATSPLLDGFNLKPLTVGLDGRIIWSPQRPAAISLSQLDITINDLKAMLDIAVDATNRPIIESLDLKLSDIDIANIITHLPADIQEKLKRLDTDMHADASMKLLKPYAITDSLSIPSVDISLNISPSQLYFGNINMNHIDILASAVIDGENPDMSTLNIERLVLQGKAIDVNISGKATGPLTNPYIDAHLATTLRLQRLPHELLSKLPVEIAGHINANTGIKLHLNDFTPKKFHRIYLDGHITLSDFKLLSRDSLLSATAGKADFDFGTSRTLKGTESSIDSLLTMSLKIDTTAVNIPGLNLRASEFIAALGSSNRSSSADTTVINPFGGLIRMKSLILDQPQDTFTMRLRNVDTRASLSRFEGIERAPELRFDLNARRIGTRMPGFALSLSQPLISINAHLIPFTNRPDSIQKNRYNKHRHAAIGNRPRRDSLSINDEMIKWNVSNDLKTLLRRWNVDGTLKSNRAFIFTNNFPLRQRASDIDLSFNTDTISLNDLKYQIGNTKLEIKGDITNIERALTGRSGRSKLRINFDINAPYIDINQLATATFHESAGETVPDTDYDDETIYVSTDVSTDTTAPRPVLIPRNIEANLSVKADSILYSDLLMHSFSGNVLINNSALNLRDLRASTDIGSASLSALYWAPDTLHMQFGLGMKLNRFYIDRVLSLIPAVDSLLPALQGFAGVINADLAATADITPTMDIDLASFKGALKLDGDSLVLLDADTFKMLAKWLVFKNKKRNMIDNMTVEVTVDNSQVEIFPFIFDIDRYRLGVMGRNDLDMNLDYHVSVLKSPLPFKFGINIKGNLDDPKIRLGGAKIKPGQATTYAIADTTRINLLGQIEDVFRRGSMSRESMALRHKAMPRFKESADTMLSANDSLLMRQEGFLPPDTTAVRDSIPAKKHRFLWMK